MLIGRDAECAALEDLLGGLRTGDGGALVLRGEAGIGKTALLREVLGHPAGVRLLWARGIESEVEIPFAGLDELLRPLLGGLGGLPPVQRAALEGALALGPPVSADRFAVYAATLGLLERRAAQAPLLAVVDDAHWLDAASTEALLFAARRLGRAPVGIVLAARPDNGCSLDSTGIPEVVIDGLAREEALLLLDRSAPFGIAPEVRERLATESAGNPLALCEVSEALTGEQLRGEASLPEPLPVGRQIEHAFVQRARALSPDGFRALLIAAASDPSDLGLVVGALDCARLTADTLEEAEAHGLLTLDDAHVEFRHPLVRSAVYQSAPRSDRRAAHRALAEALAGEKGEEAAAASAWHLAAAALGPDEELAARLEQAGAAARRRSAYRAAAMAFERAASLSRERRAAASRLLAAAEARQLAGDSGHAVSLLNQALRDTDPDDAVRAEIFALHGRIETWRGPAVAAFRSLNEEATKALDPQRAALSLADAVTSRIVVGDFPGALETARQARVLGEAAGGMAEVVTAVQLGKSLILVGEAGEGRPLILRCEELLRDGWSEVRAMDLAHCAPALMSVEEYERAERVLRTVIETASERGAAGLMPYALGALSELEVRTGHWAMAFAHGAEAVQAATTACQEGQLSYNLARLARLEAAKGLSDACREHAARALAIAHEHSFETSVLFAEWALGLLELGRGRPDAAATHLARARRINVGMGCKEPGRAEWTFDLIEALVRDSQPDEARAVLGELEDEAGHTGRVMALAAAARYRGVLSATGWEPHFARALALHERSATPFERARTELCLGERLRRERRRIEAREHLRSAQQTFDQLGAGPWTARAGEELAATGERARSRADARAADELTPHERRVARVVSEGATNREAALALFLSPKTVEAHLHSIYRKLGIRSRAELAGLIAAGRVRTSTDTEASDVRAADHRR
jgi:DNA-binding CsgD family transcriptional regulator